MKVEIELHGMEIIDVIDVEMTEEQNRKFKVLEEALSTIWNKRHEFVREITKGR